MDPVRGNAPWPTDPRAFSRPIANSSTTRCPSTAAPGAAAAFSRAGCCSTASPPRASPRSSATCSSPMPATTARRRSRASLLEPVLGRGLLTSEGSFWRRQRRIAAPAFHRRRIEGFADMMADLTEEMLGRWDTLAGTGEPLDVQSEMARVTMKIITRAMFSDRLDEAEARAVSEAIRVLEPPAPQASRLRRGSRVDPAPDGRGQRAPRVRTVDRTVNRIIAERRADSRDRGDLLSMFMLAEDEETGERMSDRQLRNETITMIIAGHETTATALVWTFYALDRHREAEERPARGGRLRPRRPYAAARRSSAPAVRAHGHRGDHAALSHGGDGLAPGRRRRRDRRRARAEGNDRQSQHLGRPPRPGDLARPRAFRSRALRSGARPRPSEARLLPVRRRAPHLHRQQFLVDGGAADPRLGRAPLAPPRAARP